MKFLVGGQYRKVVCDVCGKEVRQKDAVLIQDKWNKLNSMVVCRQDVEKVNDQIRPIIVRERIVDNIKTIRPVMPEQYVTVDTDTRLPGVPTNVRYSIDSLSGNLYILWDAPEDGGSSGIIGYSVKRAEPQLSTYSIIESNTNTNSTYYIDGSADLNSDYSYIIAAINSAGTGIYSEPGFYPTRLLDSSIVYIVSSQDELIITAGDGSYIVEEY